MKHLISINEFLNTTIGIDKTVQYILKEYKIYIKSIYENNDGIDVYYNNENITYDILTKINKIFDNYGWFTSMCGTNRHSFEKYDDLEMKEYFLTIDRKNGHETAIRYEAKFNNKIAKIPYFLYHLTPDIYYEDIIKKGLLPKSKNKISIHPNRIYLLNRCDSDDMEQIIFMLYNTLPEEVKKKIKYYYILEVEVTNLKNDFYNDPNFHVGNGAVWTNNNIPTSCITVFDKIQVNW